MKYFDKFVQLICGEIKWEELLDFGKVTLLLIIDLSVSPLVSQSLVMYVYCKVCQSELSGQVGVKRIEGLEMSFIFSIYEVVCEMY